MLHEFIGAPRDEIISRTRKRVLARTWPSVSTRELDHGVPLFLTQLAETLRLETTATPFGDGVIGALPCGTAPTCWPLASVWLRSSTTMVTSARPSPNWQWR
jgi:hypothetical protein